MTTKQTRDKVAAALAAPDKATHESILELQQALTADIAGWHERAQATSKGNNGPMGPERRKLLEGGDVDAVLRMDVESEQLQMWIAGAQTQHEALRQLDKQVFARESLANLPKQYANVAAKLQAIVELNASLLAGWQEMEGLVGDTEAMRNAVKRSGEDVPVPGPELAEVLQAAWAGACPFPAPGAFTERFNIAEACGLDARMVDTGGMRRTEVRIAA